MIRIKTYAVSTLLLFAMNSLCLSEGPLQEVARLEKQWNEAIRKINEKYVEELEKIKSELTKAGDLENALVVDARIKSIKGQTEIAGIWSFKNHDDGYEGFIIFNSDNTYNKNGKWEIKDKQLVISYYKPAGWQDRYDLPVRNGKLTGTNTKNQKLTITRKSQ